jgi:hypothetical protein
MVLSLVYYPIWHQVQQQEGSGFDAWYTAVAGLTFVMGLDVGHGRGCRVQQV